MNSKTINTLSKIAFVNGVTGSLACGTKMAYEFQKDEDTNAGKIIGGSLGALLGITVGFPTGVILTVTSPIVIPLFVYNKYND